MESFHIDGGLIRFRFRDRMFMTHVQVFPGKLCFRTWGQTRNRAGEGNNEWGLKDRGEHELIPMKAGSHESEEQNLSCPES